MHVAVVMAEMNLHALGFIGLSVLNQVHVKSQQPSVCQWEAEGTSLSIYIYWIPEVLQFPAMKAQV